MSLTNDLEKEVEKAVDILSRYRDTLRNIRRMLDAGDHERARQLATRKPFGGDRTEDEIRFLLASARNDDSIQNIDKLMKRLKDEDVHISNSYRFFWIMNKPVDTLPFHELYLRLIKYVHGRDVVIFTNRRKT